MFAPVLLRLLGLVKIKYAVNRTAGKYLNATCNKRLVMVELVLLQLSIEFLRLVVIR